MEDVWILVQVNLCVVSVGSVTPHWAAVQDFPQIHWFRQYSTFHLSSVYYLLVVIIIPIGGVSNRGDTFI